MHNRSVSECRVFTALKDRWLGNNCVYNRYIISCVLISEGGDLNQRVQGVFRGDAAIDNPGKHQHLIQYDALSCTRRFI